MPKLSIILPAYNSDKSIGKTINSLLNQSFRNYELIIIVDPSTDNTIQQIKKIKDKRIRLFINTKRKGLANSLNLGIKKSKSKILARADSDDIYLKNRLSIQYNFLKKNKKIDLVGSNTILRKKNTYLKMKYPKYHIDILWCMLFTCPFSHPSIMIRKKVFIKYGYYPNKRFEDFKFYMKALKNIKSYNIQDYLCVVNLHDNNLSIVRSKKDKIDEARMHSKNLLNFLKIKSNYEIYSQIIHNFCLNPSTNNLKKSINLIKKIRYEFLNKFPFKKKDINSDTAIKIIKVCLKRKSYQDIFKNLPFIFNLDILIVKNLFKYIFQRYILKKNNFVSYLK